MDLIKYLSLFLLLLLQQAGFAQSWAEYYVQEHPDYVRKSQIYMAHEGGNVRTIGLVSQQELYFYHLGNEELGLINNTQVTAPKMKCDGFLSKEHLTSFYLMEITGYLPYRYVSYTMRNDGKSKEIVKQSYSLPEGNSYQHFLTEEAAYVLGYTEQSGTFHIQKIGLARKDAEEFSIQLPKGIEFRKRYFDKLVYRSRTKLTNPGELVSKEHIFSEEDLLHFIYKDNGLDSLALLTLDLSREIAMKKGIMPLKEAKKTNTYIHKGSLYVYAVDKKKLSVKRFSLNSWQEETLFVLNREDERAPRFVLHKTAENNWNENGDDPLTARQMLKTLAAHEPYIYIPHAPKLIETAYTPILLGSYALAETYGPAAGVGGIPVGVQLSTGQQEAHTYTMLTINEASAVPESLPYFWKTPKKIWHKYFEKITYRTKREEVLPGSTDISITDVGALITNFNFKEMKISIIEDQLMEEVSVREQSSDWYQGD